MISSLRKEQLITFTLLCLALVSAISVAFSVHSTRQNVGKLRVQSQSNDELELEWEMLQLELSTLGGYSRIETQAVKKLKMSMPNNKQTRVIEIK